MDPSSQTPGESQSSAAIAVLRDVFADAPVGVALLTGPELVYTMTNAAYRAFIAGRDVMGKALDDALPELKGQGVVRLLKDVYKTGKPSQSDTQVVLLQTDGSYRNCYFRLTSQPVFKLGTQPREVEGVLVLATDVSLEVEANAELDRAHRVADVAQQNLHSLFMQAPVGICVFEGPEHVAVLANPVFMDILYGGPKAFIGLTVREAVPEGEAQGYFQLLDSVYQTGEPVVGSEAAVSIVTASGVRKDMFVNFIYQSKRSPMGNIDGVLVIIYDVTELVLSKRRTEAAVRARDEFLAIASHELKTPLTALQLQTQMARRTLDSAASAEVQAHRVEKLVRQTENTVQRLRRLTDDMLDSSRIATGQMVYHRTRVDVAALLRESVERMQPIALEARAPITLQGNVLEAFGNYDPLRIEQVVSNLITNAIRYAPNAPITVTAAQHGSTLQIAVADTGPGIAPDNLERIFDRFERATSARSVSGLGLGLFICQEIVRGHGGRLTVESTLGRGSTFTVELPLL